MSITMAIARAVTQKESNRAIDVLTLIELYGAADYRGSKIELHQHIILLRCRAPVEQDA
jgi:hypothetical protein